jgi:hypothetical protein
MINLRLRLNFYLSVPLLYIQYNLAVYLSEH